jgi:hypothetical protein
VNNPHFVIMPLKRDPKARAKTVTAKSVVLDVLEEILLVFEDGSFVWTSLSGVPEGWVICGNYATVCVRSTLRRKRQPRLIATILSSKRRKIIGSSLSVEESDSSIATTIQRVNTFIASEIERVRQKHDPDNGLIRLQLDSMINQQKKKIFLMEEKVFLAELDLLCMTTEKVCRMI